MQLRTVSYLLTMVAAVMVVSLVGLGWVRRDRSTASEEKTTLFVRAQRPASQVGNAGATLPTPQVVMGTPEAYTPLPEASRYTYRNDFPADRTKRLPLYLIDNQTGLETRLGNDSAAAVFGVMDDHHLVWYFAGTHVYNLITGQDILLSKVNSPSIHPQLAGNWLAFGNYNGGGTKLATLYAANVQTQEIITLARALPAGNALVNGYFGISNHLVAWYEARSTLVVYDLANHQEIVRLVDIDVVFHKPNMTIAAVSPGETVVTWNLNYGYDLVTHSYFRLGDLRPPAWDNAPIAYTSRIQEQDRTLFWTINLRDGSQRHFRAPLLDATPSTAPCVEGQNLVQNGDLESVAGHARWQQSGSSSDLIVNDPPPGLATGGQWAIRLGRFNNARQAIQQTVAVPSGVTGLTLTFAVRALSWDLWGGDRLQVDLVDPSSGQSILETPVQWSNTQLASGDWIPLQVAIENWPGIDTPIDLIFRTQTDWAFPTDFMVDEIRLMTDCS